MERCSSTVVDSLSICTLDRTPLLTAGQLIIKENMSVHKGLRWNKTLGSSAKMELVEPLIKKLNTDAREYYLMTKKILHSLCVPIGDC